MWSRVGRRPQSWGTAPPPELFHEFPTHDPIPIGAVALYRLVRRGLPSLLDILVGAFIASIATSEILREHVMNDGVLVAVSAFLSVFLAYAAGRMIIEPNLRFVTVRRIVVLALLLGPLGLYEWRSDTP